MKKLLTLLVILALAVSLVSCDLLPEELKGTIDGFIGSITGDKEPDHVHEYTFTKCTAKCEKDGENIYTCECGDSYTEPVAAFGHDIQPAGVMEATCTKKGVEYYSCTRCNKSDNKTVEALGHIYGTSDDPSDIVLCQRNGCKSATIIFPESGKYTETLTFNFTDEDKAEINAKYDEVLALLNAAAAYDEKLHGFAEEGELADAYAKVDALHTELYDLVLNAVAQRQLAEIEYYCDMENKDLEQRYSDMMDYYTDLIAQFYTLSRPFYDSCYREFYYYGMSQEEIFAFLFDSDTLANPEYTALKNRNDEIEVIFLAMDDPKASVELTALYAEFVENNNKMAQLMGYDNYVEYAYENVYSRDYSPADAQKVKDYVKKYISEAFLLLIEKSQNSGISSSDLKEYNSIATGSFFSNQSVNALVNSYFDSMAFTSNPDKQIQFADTLDNLILDGNLFRGDYGGAFVTYFSAFELPIAYFGPGYSGAFTIVHEFGHYMNEIYNNSEFDQSYDLLEMHSQGNEMIFLNHMKSNIGEGAYKLLEINQLLDMLQTSIIALSVDTFEQAVYLNEYDGVGAEVIMADGKITADEYDSLFSYVLQDFGVGGVMNPAYWRYVTIGSPCYYISYSISALSVLQLHETANTDSLEAATESYLKLFTYTETDPDMTTEQILVNAGMFSFNDEELYKALGAYIQKVAE